MKTKLTLHNDNVYEAFKNDYTKLLMTRTNKQLIELWSEVEKLEISIEVANIRGWLMDEIEKRFPKEFNEWIENCETDDNLETYIKIN